MGFLFLLGIVWLRVDRPGFGTYVPDYRRGELGHGTLSASASSSEMEKTPPTEWGFCGQETRDWLEKHLEQRLAHSRCSKFVSMKPCWGGFHWRHAHPMSHTFPALWGRGQAERKGPVRPHLRWYSLLNCLCGDVKVPDLESASILFLPRACKNALKNTLWQC